MESFDFSKKVGSKRIQEFADMLLQLNKQVGFKMSTRGWCYYIENTGMINKDQFEKVMNLMSKCRKEGLIPVDFLAEDKNRLFEGVHVPSEEQGISIEDVLASNLDYVLNGSYSYIPDYWYGEEYYVQILVEKIDLVTIFRDVTQRYRIPIANAKGWSSVYQRAEYARRFKEAEDKGMKCVLLYCGDFDPDGLRISDTIMSNLVDVKDVYFEDGTIGYDPSDLIIDRFGINYDFIQKNNFTWIDNLITGSGLNLADKNHRNHKMPYAQNYIKKYGVRKCESNAMVNVVKEAQNLCKEAIEKYLGKDANKRFDERRRAANAKYKGALHNSGLYEPIVNFLNRNNDY